MKLLYYIIIGIFFRVDLRSFTAIFYQGSKRPVFQVGSRTSQGEVLDYYSNNPQEERDLSWINKQNLNRLKFGKNLISARADQLLDRTFLKIYFLEDTHIRIKGEKPAVTGMIHKPWLLKVLKFLTRTPYQKYIYSSMTEKEYKK